MPFRAMLENKDGTLGHFFIGLIRNKGLHLESFSLFILSNNVLSCVNLGSLVSC